MKYIYQCYFYIYTGSQSFFRRIIKCGPLHSCYDQALEYLENFKKNEAYFCAGFIYEFIHDHISYRKLTYTTDSNMGEPELFLEKHINDNNIELNR